MTRMTITRVLSTTLVACAFSGCGSRDSVRFRLNFEGRDRSEVTRPQQQTLVDALTAAFGTPDEPYAFPETGLDINKLTLAAGPSMSDHTGKRQGLYRQHCAHCHGISGDGLGPTAAFLNPYPRDYRKGVFKFTSTGGGAKATREDLRRTVVQGIPGTAMPSFALLPDDEIDALVEYVKYLCTARRNGGPALRLCGRARERRAPDARDCYERADADGGNVEPGRVADRASAGAAGVAGPIDAPTPASLAAGRKLFQDTKLAQCVNCHGPTALGDGSEVRYDDWNKGKQELIKIGKPELIAELFSLPIQRLKPRNLRMGIYRGGRRPVDLYRRIYAGIKGAEMPAGGSDAGQACRSQQRADLEPGGLRPFVAVRRDRGRPKPHAHTAHLQTN